MNRCILLVYTRRKKLNPWIELSKAKLAIHNRCFRNKLSYSNSWHYCLLWCKNFHMKDLYRYSDLICAMHGVILLFCFPNGSEKQNVRDHQERLRLAGDLPGGSLLSLYRLWRVSSERKGLKRLRPKIVYCSCYAFPVTVT